MNNILWVIRQRLFQRSKKCRDHYSTIYHAKSQWVKRSDTHLSSWINVKKSVRLKFKIKSIACRFLVFAVCLPVYRIGMLEIILGEALPFGINIFLLQHFVDDIKVNTQCIAGNLIIKKENFFINSSNSCTLDRKNKTIFFKKRKKKKTNRLYS